MPRYLFSSHDGFGLGHVKRNATIARALLAAEPEAEVTLVTGAARKPSWLGDDPRLGLVAVPPLIKDSSGAYRNGELSFEEALRQRAVIFERTVAEVRPDVIVVDRHPYGTAGELRPGLEAALAGGARLVLGLRDILDEPVRVRQELAGDGWAGVADLFDTVLVYGEASLCDHEAEYGLPVRPTYCGWVVEAVSPAPRDPAVVAVAAGGGGDGDAVYTLAGELADLLPDRRVVVAAGPYASRRLPLAGGGGRVTVARDVPGCAGLFARAGAVVQMAGYNSTVESLAAGVRPILVPRRSPRREQAIRATRLAAMGLADVVDEGAPADEVAWLLGRPRLLADGQVEAHGLRLDGAVTAASHLMAQVGTDPRLIGPIR